MLSLKVLDFNKGDEVITPCLNFGTAVSSLMHFGLSPILVDVDISTLQIDISKLNQKKQKHYLFQI